MATVAASTTTKPTSRDAFGSRSVRFVDITFSASYTTGGESVTLANLRGGGLPVMGIDFIAIEPITVSAVHYRFEYDRTNAKVIVYNAGTGAEIANTTDLSGVTARAMVIGK